MCSKTNCAKLEEFLLRRYHNIEFIMSMEFMDFADFIVAAEERELREELWQMYVAVYPFMTEETYESFTEFYEKRTGKNLVMIPKEQMLEEARQIMRKGGV